jgi:hypothetical protein
VPSLHPYHLLLANYQSVLENDTINLGILPPVTMTLLSFKTAQSGGMVQSTGPVYS